LATDIGNERAWGSLHPLIAATLSDAGVPSDRAIDFCCELRPWVEACRGGWQTEASIPLEVKPKFNAIAAVLLRFLHETSLELVSRVIDREISHHASRRETAQPKI
jgi:hypothetical protein